MNLIRNIFWEITLLEITAIFTRTNKSIDTLFNHVQANGCPWCLLHIPFCKHIFVRQTHSRGYFAKYIIKRSCNYLRLHNMYIKRLFNIITEHKLPGIVWLDRMPPLHGGILTATFLVLNSCRQGRKQIHVSRYSIWTQYIDWIYYHNTTATV